MSEGALSARISDAPGDPIFGIVELFRADARPYKINLAAGVYMDEQGVTPILPSVRAAEERLDALLLTSHADARYFSGMEFGPNEEPVAGSSGWLLVSGDDLAVLVDSRYTVQARREAPLATALDYGSDAGETIGRWLVAHGVIGPGHGIDELTTATANCVQGCGRLREVSGVWRAEEYGLVASPFAELQGGGLVENVAIVEALLAGRGARGLVDTIALNVAVALWIVGKVATVREGIEPARDLLLGGAVRKKITATREFYLS